MTTRWMFLLAALFVFACGVPQRRAPAGPIVTKPGEPVRTASSALVGPAGGTLASPDGTVTIEVPAGALAEPTMLTMQPITNTAPLGVSGAAVRLGPSGQRFAVPATLKLRLTADQLAGSDVEALWVLTQTKEGAWRARLRRTVDANARTISVRLMGFSDWAVGRFIDLRLDSSSTVVEPLGSVTLRATGFLPASEPGVEDELAPLVGFSDGEGELAPLVPRSEPEDELAPLTSFDEFLLSFSARAWQLSGEGSLQPDGLRAVYVAPASVPAQNPVTVSLELAFDRGGREKFLLLKPILIQQDGLWLELDGVRREAPAQFVQVLRGSDRVPALSVSVSDGWQLSLDVDRPRAGTFALKRCGPDDVQGSALSVSPLRDFTYDTTYWERSAATGVCVVMAGSCGHQGVTLRLADYDGSDGALISGAFEGTLYEDEDRNPRRLGQPCLTSRPVKVRGGFVGRLSLEE